MVPSPNMAKPNFSKETSKPRIKLAKKKSSDRSEGARLPARKNELSSTIRALECDTDLGVFGGGAPRRGFVYVFKTTHSQYYIYV